MISNNEFPLTPDGCRLVQETVDNADFNVVLKVSIVTHCEKCLSCQKYVQQLANLRTLLISQVVVEAPLDFDIKLRQKIAATKQVQLVTPWWQWISQPALGATAAALVMIAVLAGIDRIHFTTTQPTVVTPNTASVATKYAPKQIVEPRSFTSEVPNNSDVASNSPEVYSAPVAASKSPVSNRARVVRRVISKPNGDIAISEINVEVKYGSSLSQTLPVSAVVYGAKPVVNIDNNDESKSVGTFKPGMKIF